MSRSAKTKPSNTDSESAAGSGILRTLPPGVWALGFVSLLMDTSSELIHSLLPVFMSTVLGASMMTIGMVEGIAEATASITKVFQAQSATTSENANCSPYWALAWRHLPNRSFPWRALCTGCLPPVLSTGSAKASGGRRATPW